LRLWLLRRDHRRGLLKSFTQVIDYLLVMLDSSGSVN